GKDFRLHMLGLFQAPGAQPAPGPQFVALAQGLVVELPRVAGNGVAVFVPLKGIIGIVEPDHAPRRLSLVLAGLPLAYPPGLFYYSEEMQTLQILFPKRRAGHGGRTERTGV